MRVVVFAVVFYSVVQTKSVVDRQFEEVGSGVNFTPVKDIATTGLFKFSRNPLYLAMLGLLPAASVLFDTKWLLMVSAPLLFVYLHFVVIPAEEKFLSAQIGDSYSNYLRTTPRWISWDALQLEGMQGGRA